MALNQSTTQKVSDWFQNYNEPTAGLEESTPGVMKNPSSPVPPVRSAPTVIQQQSDGDSRGPNVLIPPTTIPGTGAPTGTNTFGAGGAFGTQGTTPTYIPQDLPPVVPPPPPPPPQTTTGVLNSQTPPPSPPPATTPATPAPVTTPATPTPANGITSTLTGQHNANGSTTITPSSLTTRTIDPATETVQGQQTSLLNQNSPYVQGFRDRAVRAANDRGLANSTMAGTGGEEAAAQASLPIAEADAGIYGKAHDYNTALANQALMFNVDSQNQFQLQSNTIEGQRAIANISAASAANVAGINAASALSTASLSAENQRFIAQANNAQSRYNTDSNYRLQQDQQRHTILNNIIQNMDMDPAYKKRLADAYGFPEIGKALFTPDAELNGGSITEGHTKTLGGQHQIYRNGKYEIDTSFGSDGRG